MYKLVVIADVSHVLTQVRIWLWTSTKMIRKTFLAIYDVSCIVIYD